MDYSKPLHQEAISIEVAKDLIIKEAKTIWNATEDELIIEVVREPQKGLFRRNGMIEARLNSQAIEKRKAEELKKLQEEEKKREEEEKRKIENERKEKELKSKQLCDFISEFEQPFPLYMINYMLCLTSIASSLNQNGCLIEAENILEDINEMMSDIANITDKSYANMAPIIKRHYKGLYCKYRAWGKYEQAFETDLYTPFVDIFSEYLGQRSTLYTKLIVGAVYDHISDVRDDVSKNQESLPPQFMYMHHYYLVLACLPYLILDIQNAKRLISNKELYTVAFNCNEGGVVCSDLEKESYNVYRTYYRDTFMETLSSADFQNVVNVAILLNKYKGSNTKYSDYILEKSGVNVSELVGEIQCNCQEGETFFQYLLEEKIEKGYLDRIFSDESEAQVLVDLEALCLGHILLKNNFKYYLLELREAVGVFQRANAYADKYRLLHMDVADLDVKSRIRQEMSQVKTGVDFENVLKKIYENKGYIVETTKTTGDQGADLLLEKAGIKTVIQAKFYSSPVGNSAVQEVVGAVAYYGADSGVVVTNNEFTPAAKELAAANSVMLVDGDMLNRLIDSL